jgi:hypothetical protein
MQRQSLHRGGRGVERQQLASLDEVQERNRLDVLFHATAPGRLVSPDVLLGNLLFRALQIGADRHERFVRLPHQRRVVGSTATADPLQQTDDALRLACDFAAQANDSLAQIVVEVVSASTAQ